MKTPISWYGGKQMMLRYIIPIIPNHEVYTESFFGGGAVFFAKPPAACEVINDLNNEAVNFYRVSKTNHQNLAYHVTTTLHSRNAYDDAKVIYSYPHLFDEVKRAWAFYTMCNQSFSSNLSSFGFDRTGSTPKKLDNKRINFTYEIEKRLERATIESDDAIKVITRYDTDKAFHYVDPPYFNSNCGHYGGYKQSDFESLLQTLSQVKGKFLLSSYPSDILKDYTKEFGWDQVGVEKSVAVSKNINKKKIEVLTANYPIASKVKAIMK